jgi:hypothetical protein
MCKCARLCGFVSLCDYFFVFAVQMHNRVRGEDMLPSPGHVPSADYYRQLALAAVPRVEADRLDAKIASIATFATIAHPLASSFCAPSAQVPTDRQRGTERERERERERE